MSIYLQVVESKSQPVLFVPCPICQKPAASGAFAIVADDNGYRYLFSARVSVFCCGEEPIIVPQFFDDESSARAMLEMLVSNARRAYPKVSFPFIDYPSFNPHRRRH